jgi:hypothetical protein
MIVSLPSTIEMSPLATISAELVHRSRGRKSNLKADPVTEEAILKRYEEGYEGFGPTLAMEKLREEKYTIHAETLRIWLMEAGLWQPPRKRSAYRQRREPKKRFGEMVQLDGSHHRWFQERSEESPCLMSMIGVRRFYDSRCLR